MRYIDVGGGSSGTAFWCEPTPVSMWASNCVALAGAGFSISPASAFDMSGDIARMFEVPPDVADGTGEPTTDRSGDPPTV